MTSADNEQANSTLKLVKGYLRTTMTTDRLSGLALMNIHHKKPLDYDAVVQKFAEQQPRRMLLADPIFEESWIFNLNEFKMFIRLDYCQC